MPYATSVDVAGVQVSREDTTQQEGKDQFPEDKPEFICSL